MDPRKISYVAFENFCPQIEAVKQSYINSGFGNWTPPQGISGHKTYPGMSFHGESSYMFAALHQALGTAPYGNFTFARQTNDESDPAFIHSDRHDGAQTCICYMSEEDGESGTAFFQHKGTGWTRMPPVEWLTTTKTGVAPPDNPMFGGFNWFPVICPGWIAGKTVFENLWADMQNTTPEIWTRKDFVHAAYNKAVVFDAPLFHQRVQPTNIKTEHGEGRIVWVSHFKTAADVVN